MKQVFKIAPLALAVAALSFNVAANGNDGYGDGGHRGDDGATLKKYVKVSKEVKYKGKVKIKGTIEVDSLGMAVVDQEQDSDDNGVLNDRVDNTAVLGGNALNRAKGNIGINSAAGGTNVQSNAAALAAADAAFVLGSADAEVFVDQNADGNTTWNHGTMNNALIGGNALRNARGNIGVNSAAGNSNVQGNSFAGAVASGSMGEATVSVKQESEGNHTINLPEETYEVLTTNFSVGGTLSGTYEGEGSGGYRGTNGPAAYSGTSEQSNDVYPEVWLGGDHPGGSQQTGHIDFDNQGVNDGRFEFTESGTIGRSRESGRLGFSEVGTQSLSGTLTGSAQYIVSRYVRHQNNAIFAGDALNGARGNIGVNNAAGTANLQNNSLAISRVNAAPAAGGGEGGGGGE